jgi:hypothetical protein
VVLVPSIYAISKGVSTVADRVIYEASSLPDPSGGLGIANLFSTIRSLHIEYAISVDGTEMPAGLRVLLPYSDNVFESGPVHVYGLPAFNPPSPSSSVTVIDKESLGIGSAGVNFGWLEDSFVSGWSYIDANASSDGEVLTIYWDFHRGDYDVHEPAAATVIPPANTDKFPYLVVRYRNTNETTSTADSNIGQIITLRDSTGFVDEFLPVSRDGRFHLSYFELPRGMQIQNVSVWMRNYKQLSGTIRLELDYLGLSSVPFQENLDLKFLTVAVPALWPAKYSVFPSWDKLPKSSLVIGAYDKTVPASIDRIDSPRILLMNFTASFPQWGRNWTVPEQGMVLGLLNGKQVLIIGVDQFRPSMNSLSELSSAILFDSGWRASLSE